MPDATVAAWLATDAIKSPVTFAGATASLGEKLGLHEGA
jgi:hypothetical protein